MLINVILCYIFCMKGRWKVDIICVLNTAINILYQRLRTCIGGCYYYSERDILTVEEFYCVKTVLYSEKKNLVLSFWLSFHETVRDCDKVWLGLNACVLDVLWMRELNLTCTVFIFDLLCQCNLPLRVRQSQLQWFSNDITPDAALSRVKFWKKKHSKRKHFYILSF